VDLLPSSPPVRPSRRCGDAQHPRDPLRRQLLLPLLGVLADGAWTVMVTAAASAATGSFSAAAVTLTGETDRLVGEPIGSAAAHPRPWRRCRGPAVAVE
jgi:hypothetical protein